MAKKKIKRKYKSRYKRKYATAGMYQDNTIQAAGQGGVGSTANIVFGENNPAVVQQAKNFLADQKRDAIETNKQVASEDQNIDDKALADMQAIKQKQMKNDAMVSAGMGTIKEGLTKTGLLKKQKGIFGSLKEGIKAYKAQRAANLLAKGQKGISQGVQTLKQAKQTAKGLKLAKESVDAAKGTGDLLKVGAGTSQVAQGAATAGKTGSALSAGVSAAANVNVIAAAANYGGKAIKKWQDDDDETTWTAGEATGDILGDAGEYAGYGAMIGSVVPGIGTAIGAGVGAVVGAGKAVWQNLAARRKARRVEGLAKQRKLAKVDKYNKEVKENILSAESATRAHEMKEKTYSGYDLGRNVTAKYGGIYANGGMKMGVPRYGYTA